VIGDLVVLFAVGSDLVCPLPTPHLSPPLPIHSVLVGRSIKSGNTRLQGLPREASVLMLRLGRRLGFYACRQVAHHHTGIGCVSMLPAWARIPGCERLNISFIKNPAFGSILAKLILNFKGGNSDS
jgi:hypothetical protein